MDLLNLPVRALERVLQLLDPCELVILSCCSTKTKRAIQSTPFPHLCTCDDHPSASFIARFIWPLNVLSQECGLELRRDVDRPMEWTFGAPWRPHLYKKFEIKYDGVVNDCYTLLEKAEGDEFKYWVSIASMPAALGFTRYILQLLRIPLSDLLTNIYELDLMEFLHAEVCRDANRLTLYGDVRQAQLAQALEHRALQLYSLTIQFCFHEPFEPTSPLLNIPALHFENGLFIRWEHIRNFTGRYLYVKRSLFSSEGFLEIVRTWQNSENRTLRVLILIQYFRLDRDEIFSRLEAVESQPRDKYPLCAFINNHFKPEELMDPTGHDETTKDIVREDGVKATIRIIENQFVLMVWPETL